MKFHKLLNSFAAAVLTLSPIASSVVSATEAEYALTASSVSSEDETSSNESSSNESSQVNDVPEPSPGLVEASELDDENLLADLQAALDSSHSVSASEADGNKIESLSAAWITPDSKSDGDINTLNRTWASTSNEFVQLKVNYALSGKHAYPAGSIRLTVPKRIFKNRRGEWTGQLTQSVPESPDHTALFAYTQTDDTVTLTNTKELAAATSGVFEMTFKDLSPIDIKDMSSGYVTEAFTPRIDVTTKSGTVISKTSSNSLKAKVDTHAILDTVRVKNTGISEGWNDTWPSELKPADAESNLYTTWTSESKLNVNQAYNLAISQSSFESNGRTRTARVLGYEINSTGQIIKGSPNGKQVRANSSDLTDDYVTYYVSYPKTDFSSKETYRLTARVSSSLTAIDDRDTQEKEDSAEINYTPYRFIPPTGRIFGEKNGSNNVTYYGEGHYPLFLNKLRLNKPVDITYDIASGGFGYMWTQKPGTDSENPDNFGKVPYTIEIEDSDLSIDGSTKLGSEDYEFKSLEITFSAAYVYKKYSKVSYGYYEDPNSQSISEGQINKGQYGYELQREAFDGSHIEILGSKANGEYVKYADVEFHDGLPTITPSNGASASGAVLEFPQGITAWKTLTTSKAAAAKYSFSPKVTIKPSAKIKSLVEKLFKNSDSPTTHVSNTIRSVLDSQHGRVDLNIWKPTGINHLEGMSTGVSLDKSLTYEDSPKLRKAILHYSSKLKYETNLTNEKDVKYAIRENLIKEETSSTWYDLLPRGVHPVTRSIHGRENDNVESVEMIPNFKNTGRTLLKVKMSLSPDYKYQAEAQSNIGQAGYYDAPEIHFDAFYSYDEILSGGKKLSNYMVYQSRSNETLGTIDGHKGEPDNPLAGNHDESKSAVDDLASTLTDLDTNSDSNSFVYAKNETSLAIDAYALTSLSKFVDVNNENDFGSGLDEEFAKNVYGNSVYKYRLRVKNPDDSESKNIRFFDKIEAYTPTADDVYDYKDAQWKGTLQGVDVSEIEAKGAKPVVYYSTKKDIVVNDQHNRRDTDLSNTAIWSTKMPADKSSITAVAIDVTKKADGSPFTLEASGEIQASLIMRSPEIHNDEVVDKNLAPGESEAGMNGGSHAYNDSVMISTSVKNGKVVSDDLLVRHGYTKVGLKRYRMHVTKHWDDDRNRDNIRPASIRMHLVANGKRTFRSIELNEKNEWSGQFDNLEYIGSDGFPISYTIDEDVPARYTFRKGLAKVVSDGISYDITNVHLPETISINGKKSWRGDDPAQRPKTIQMALYGNGDKVKSIIVSSDANWQYSFDDVPKYEAGRPIEYTVKEEYVDNYRIHYNGYNIENEYYPYGDIILTKRVKNATSSVTNKDFEFTLLVKKDNGDPDSDSYKYETTDGRRGSISNGGKLTLRADQSVTVKDIHSKYSYEWIEKIEDGFESTSENSSGVVKSIPNPVATFTNTYSTVGSTVLRGRKVLQNKKQEPYQFTFDLFTENNQLIRSATNDSNGEIYFGSIQYSNEDAGRTYRYKIRERDLGERGYTYDRHEDIVTVRVVDNGDGTMTATPTYDNDGATFTNTYNATGEIRLTAYKSMKYTVQKAAAGEFNFELVNESNQVVATGSNDADGVIAFTPIRINQSHIGQTLTFTGREKRGTDGNTNYDLSTVTYKVRVSDAGDGTLNYEVIEQTDNKPEGNDSHTPTFTNSRKDGSLKISKEATGGNANDEFRFRVTLEGLESSNSELNIERGSSERVSSSSRVRRSLPDEIFDEAVDVASSPTAFQNIDLGEVDDSVIGIWDPAKGLLEIKLSPFATTGILSRAKFRALDFLPQVSRISISSKDNTSLRLDNQSYQLFMNMINLERIDGLDKLNLRYVNNVSEMFKNTPKLKYIDVSKWDVSNVQYFYRMFDGASSLTSLDVRNWNTSSAIHMHGMFKGASKLASLDVSRWNVDKVQRFYNMFEDASSLTSLDVRNWNTSSATHMHSMFKGASKLASLDVSRWNVGKVQAFYNMFEDASSLTSLDVRDWNTSSATGMNDMFKGASKLATLDVSRWNVSKVQNFTSMFENASSLTSLDVRNWDTSLAANLTSMFKGASKLASLDVSRWNVSKVQHFTRLFEDASSLTSLDVRNWNTSSAISMGAMFKGTSKLATLDVSRWNVGKVQYFYKMFEGASSLTSLDVRDWNTSSATSMNDMFKGASKLATIDVSHWNTTNVKSAYAAFENMPALNTLSISNWKLQNLTNVDNFIKDSTSLVRFVTPAVTTRNTLLLKNIPELYNEVTHRKLRTDSLQSVQSSQTWIKIKDAAFYTKELEKTAPDKLTEYTVNTQNISGDASRISNAHASSGRSVSQIDLSKLNVSNASRIVINDLLPQNSSNDVYEGIDMSTWVFPNRPTNISGMFKDRMFGPNRTDNFLKWPASSKLIAGDMSNMFKGVTGSQVIDITGLDTRQATNTANALDLGNNNRIEKLILGEHSLLKKDMFGDLSRYNGYVWTHSSGQYGPWTTEELVNKYVGGAMKGEFTLSRDTRVVVKTTHPNAITSAQAYEARINVRSMPEINKVLTSQAQQNTRDYEFLGYGYAFAQTDGTVGNYAEKLIEALPDSNESRAFLTQFIEFLKAKNISTNGINANKASLAKMRQAIQGSEFTSLSDAFNKFASAKPDLKSTFVALINKGTSHSTFASANPVTFTSIWAPKRTSVTLSNNSFEITMRRGESVTIKGLPANVKYSIEEITSPGYSVKASVNISGTIPSNSTAKAFFENEYNPGKTSVQLRAKKQFEHNSRTVNGYQFEITPLNGAPGTKHTVNSDDAGIAQFNKVEFTRAGTYKYKVREIAGSDSNVQYDSSQKEITVNVTSVQGRMTANVVNDAPIFTNRLKKGSIVVSKQVTGHQNPNADTFTFELLGDAGRTKERFTLKNGQSKTFSDLPYGSRYEIREINIPAGYKPSQANTSVTVSQARHDVSITNAFEYEGSVNLAAKKVLNGRKLQSGEFTFEVVDANNRVVATTTNSADGTIAFDAIKITQPGTTTFKIREVRPTNTAGITYDTHEEVVTVRSSVIDRTNGLASTVTYSSEHPTFTNTVNPPNVDDDAPNVSNERDVKIRKTIDGVTDGNKDVPFTVKVSITRNDAPITRLYRLEGTRQTTSAIAHGQTFTIKHDETVTIKKLPIGTKVVIEEVVPEGYTLDRSSKTELSVSSAATQPTMTLVNNYRASGEWQPTVRKTLRNSTLQDNQFRFVMTKNGKVVQRVTNKADGSVPFAPEYYTLDDVGKTYNYEIFESNDRADKIRYDKSVHRISVTVTDDGHGHITAQADTNSVGFVNVYDPDLPATGTLGVIVSVSATIALLGAAFYLNKLRKRA